jgi:hypothetical protein
MPGSITRALDKRRSRQNLQRTAKEIMGENAEIIAKNSPALNHTNFVDH